MTSVTDLSNYDSDGGAVFSLTNKQAEKFDKFLLELPVGDQRVYWDSHPGRLGDVEREEAFQRGVRHAVSAVQSASLADDVFHDLPILYGRHRSKAKTEAKQHFAKTGERPRSRQLEIDFWRGAHHAAYVIRDRMYDILRFSDDDDALELYLASLPELLPALWKVPDFPITQELFKALFELKPELQEKILHDHQQRARAAQTKKTTMTYDENRFNVPGFIDDVSKLMLETAPYPNRGLAFCGAMTLLALLASRKVMFEGMTPNEYFLALANSGSGKDWPRKVICQLLSDAGMFHCLGDSFASGEAIEDALFVSPAMLFQCDEFDGVIAAMGGEYQTRFESLKSALLKFYTSAGSSYFLRRRAGQEQRTIFRPHLNLFATCTPGAFYDAVSAKMATGGLLPRLLVVQAENRGVGQRAKAIVASKSITEAINRWRDLSTTEGNLATLNPEPIELAITPEASTLLDAFRLQCDTHYSECQSNHDEAGCAIWARAYEHAIKLAMLYACSANTELGITAEAVVWSSNFAEQQVAAMLQAFRDRPESDFEKLCTRLTERVLASEQGVSRSTLLKYSKVDAKTFDNAIRTLTERNDIAATTVQTKGRMKTVYVFSPIPND